MENNKLNLQWLPLFIIFKNVELTKNIHGNVTYT